MSDVETIPLFPLAIVVFPGQTLPLHIFEERYKEMLADCRAAAARQEELPIGIVYGEDGDVRSDVGCAVVLEKVLNEYEDGRLDIITEGQRRFRVLQVSSDRAYLMAAVRFIDDDPEDDDPVLLTRVQSAYIRMSELIESDTGTRLETPAPQHSFQIALAAGTALDVRQELLQMTSERERLQRLASHFEQAIPDLEARQARRRKVRSNGHTRK